MGNITISLPENRLVKLKEMAAKLGPSPEELVPAGVQDLLGRPEEELHFPGLRGFV